MNRERRHRSLVVALLLSLVVHVCLLIWFRASRSPAPPPAHRDDVAELELEFVSVPQKVASEKKTAEVVAPKKKVPRAMPREVDPVVVEKVQTPPPEKTTEDEGKLSSIVPSQLPGDFKLPPTSRGKTIHNTPEELPDADTLRIAEEERVRARVNGIMGDALAVAKVESGGGDLYVGHLREVLKEAAAKPPAFENDSFPKRLITQYKDGAARYGKTGVAYDVAHSPYDDRGQTPLEHELEIARNRGPSGGAGAAAVEELNRTLQMGQNFRALGDGKLSNGLTAIVELNQDRDAKLISFQLVQASGNPVFDKFVMELAPKSLDSVKPYPSGAHPNGLRTWWEFKGTVTYQRSVRQMNLKDDWWYVTAMLPAGLVTGTFEETTGDVYIVDIRNPQYKCSVRLLRVYE